MKAIEGCIHKENLKKLGLFTGTKENYGDLIPAFVVQSVPVLIAGQIILTVRHESKFCVVPLCCTTLLLSEPGIPRVPEIILVQSMAQGKVEVHLFPGPKCISSYLGGSDELPQVFPH